MKIMNSSLAGEKSLITQPLILSWDTIIDILKNLNCNVHRKTERYNKQIKKS